MSFKTDRLILFCCIFQVKFHHKLKPVFRKEKQRTRLCAPALTCRPLEFHQCLRCCSDQSLCPCTLAFSCPAEQRGLAPLGRATWQIWWVKTKQPGPSRGKIHPSPEKYKSNELVNDQNSDNSLHWCFHVERQEWRKSCFCAHVQKQKGKKMYIFYWSSTCFVVEPSEAVQFLNCSNKNQNFLQK